jgi:hypothetical protein
MNTKENLYFCMYKKHDEAIHEQKSEERKNDRFDTARTLMTTKYTLDNAHAHTPAHQHLGANTTVPHNTDCR